jgi:3'-phosphoadenosine 5'-phosphosulfate sulfotransferase (PAPS reductase)/FAD synthetase
MSFKMFKIKQCIFCKRQLPVGYFHRNLAATDGYWSWCKKCEKMYGYYQARGDEKYVVSFSGGKDSTAMLLRLIEEKKPIDAIIYFDCGSFEWPQMSEHIKLVEKNTGKQIIKIHSHKDFLELASKLQPNNKEINGWPTPMMRWCTMIKINMIRQTLRPYRPYIQYIGFSSDENDRVLKASASGSSSQKVKFFKNRFPLVEWNMKESDCLKYCKDHGYHWDGLYDNFSRVSCWCCPLQNNTDLFKLCKKYPEMWKKLKQWDALMPDRFKRDPLIFKKIESRNI